MKKIIEAIAEKGLLICGWSTSLAIVLIVLFLFREGLRLFSSGVVEEGYSIVVNRHNPVSELSSRQIMDIFDGRIASWEEVGGKDAPIMVFRLNDITGYYPEEALGENLENVPQVLNSLVEAHEDIIAFLPRQYIVPDFEGKILLTGTISPKDFFAGKQWYPTAQPAPQFGFLPLLAGTLWVSVWAIIFSLPFGLAVAIYLAELAGSRIRNMLKPVIELLAGIPSVVYGFFGLVVIVPLIQRTFDLPVGETGFAGSLILAVMALPTIITVAEDALRTTPRAMKEASLALGATHWQTIRKVVIPYSISGITAAAVLGIGRAIGETMAVLMVTGNAAVIPRSLFVPMRTIPATIAAELGEAPSGGVHYKALFLLGSILFVLTLIISISVEFISKNRQGRGV